VSHPTRTLVVRVEEVWTSDDLSNFRAAELGGRGGVAAINRVWIAVLR
jgi:hypothetical protein